MNLRLHRHPVNVAHYDQADHATVAAEKFVRTFGSIKFLAWQTVVIIGWIALNITAYRLRWDPFPFILLNLVFSTQAAYAAPLILFAQDRQSERDRRKAEHDYGVNEEALELQKRHAAVQSQVLALLESLASALHVPVNAEATQGHARIADELPRTAPQ